MGGSMALGYDFDIFEVIPQSNAPDSRLDGLLAAAGFSPQDDSATVALFRDPATAEALRRAPKPLRDYFEASGFGYNTFSSGAPSGRYPAKDEAARLAIILRLTENAARHALPPLEPASGTAFSLADFLAALDRAQPIDPAAPLVLHAPVPAASVAATATASPKPRRRTLPAMFQTDPGTASEVDSEDLTPRRKFWQHRFFRIGAAAALVLVTMQLVKGPAFTVLASL